MYGVDGIEIGQETHMGQVYAEFQKYLGLVKDTGVMLTVCSKNDEENALAGLNHGGDRQAGSRLSQPPSQDCEDTRRSR